MTFTLINTLPQKRNDTVVVKTYIPGGDFAILDEKGNKVDYTVIESRDLTDYHRQLNLIHHVNSMFQVRFLKLQ